MSTTSKIPLPCGYIRSDTLEENIRHYGKCDHEFCRSRAAAWCRVVEKFIKEDQERPVEILDLKVYDNNPSDGTATVRGITNENYQANRVFYWKGKRWVLQGRFGGGDGIFYYFALQRDLDLGFFPGAYDKATELLALDRAGLCIRDGKVQPK